RWDWRWSPWPWWPPPGSWPAPGYDPAALTAPTAASDVDLDLAFAARDAGDDLRVHLVVHQELVHVLDLAGHQRHHAGAADPALAGVVHADPVVEQRLQERLTFPDLDRDAGLQALGGEGLSDQRHGAPPGGNCRRPCPVAAGRRLRIQDSAPGTRQGRTELTA